MSCISKLNIKKPTLIFATLILVGGVFISSCKTPVREVEIPENYVLHETDSSNRVDLSDLEAFLQETADTVAVNEQRIADFKERIKNEKGAVQAEFHQKIADLELKNRDLNKRMDTYRKDGIAEWESFKMEINQEVNDLSSAIKDLTAPIME